MARKATVLKREKAGPSVRELVPALLKWFAVEARDLPWRRTCDPYAVWISEIMLQQTQVKTVIPFYERWMRTLPTIASVARANPAKILKLWEGLGYYTRARNLQAAATTIVELHHGIFPKRYEEVLSLKGIGRYTAGAICSIAFNLPVPILDGNVIRVLTRVFGVAENPKEPKTNERLWSLAQNMVQIAALEDPAKNLPRFFGAHSSGHCSHLNQSLMELGALLCSPKQPQCGLCPLQASCIASQRGLIERLPNIPRREQPTARQFMALVAHGPAGVLVQQRPAGVVNAHLWEFPNVEITGRKLAIRDVGEELFGLQLRDPTHLCTIKHTITRYRITLEAHQTQLVGKRGLAAGIGKWCTAADLKRLAFPSAHRKIANALLKSGFIQRQ
ncbi:MAG TPA: A/G-specific adenine glycosylase [Candidatus Saccharimonadales bacterium]|nr:A/G-specific adenine glycosylase [Candidatus Saccharimonadales bacterium]